MGGFGSGRTGGKRTTADTRVLDVRRLKREGMLEPESSRAWAWSSNGVTQFTVDVTAEADAVVLAYGRRQGGDWSTVVSRVWLEHTPCNFGGSRLWWRCPARGCGRRVAVLYRPAGGVFACRHCHELAYKSQRETPSDRGFRAADKLRDRLGWTPGIAHGPGQKPPRMHWRTYLRLLEVYNRQTAQACAGTAAYLGRIQARSRKVLAKWR